MKIPQTKVQEKYKQIIGIYLALIIFIGILYLISPSFVHPKHLVNILRQAAPLGIVGIGQTIVLLTGGLDLSVGATITLIDVLAAGLTIGIEERTLGVVFLCLAIGSAIGLANGVGITKWKIHPVVMTLGMMSVITGISYVYTGGTPRGSIPSSLRFIGMGRIGFMPVAAIIWIIVIIGSILLLRKTVVGRWIYAVGGNIKTAYLSGVNVNLIIILAYVLCGFLAALAGLILAGYIGTASLGLGEPYLFNSLIVTLIGGTSFTGGVGGIEGTIAGTLIITLLFSVLTMANIGHSGKLIAQGLVIMGMVVLYTKRKS